MATMTRVSDRLISKAWNFSRDNFDYQIVQYSNGRVRLWYRDSANGWELGHGKDIPTGRSGDFVAHTMEQFIRGLIDHDEYNQILPN